MMRLSAFLIVLQFVLCVQGQNVFDLGCFQVSKNFDSLESIVYSTLPETSNASDCNRVCLDKDITDSSEYVTLLALWQPATCVCSIPTKTENVFTNVSKSFCAHEGQTDASNGYYAVSCIETEMWQSEGECSMFAADQKQGTQEDPPKIEESILASSSTTEQEVASSTIKSELSTTELLTPFPTEPSTTTQMDKSSTAVVSTEFETQSPSTGPTSTSPPETTSEDYDETTTGPTSTSPPETTSEDYDETTTGPTSTSPPETTSEEYDDTTTGPTSTSPPETTSEDYDDTTTGPTSTSPPETTSEDYDDTTTGPTSTSLPTTSEDYDDTTTGPTSTSPPETTSVEYDDTTTGPTSTSPPETTSEEYDEATTTGPTSTSPPETTSEDYDDTTTGPTSTSPPETTSEEYDDTTTGPTSTSPPETTSEEYDDTTTGPTSTSPPETTSEDYDDTTTGPTSTSLPTTSEDYDDTTTGPTSTSPPETTSEDYDDTTTGPTSTSLPTTSEDYDDTTTGPTSTSPPETTSEDYDDTTTGPTSTSLPTTSEDYDDTTTGPTSTSPPETTSEEYDETTTTGPTSTSPPETTSEDYDDTTTGPSSTSPPETTSEDYDDTTTGPTSTSLPTTSEDYDDTTTGPTSTSPPETTSEDYDDTTTGPTSTSLPTTSEDYDDTTTGPTSTSPPETTSEEYDETTTTGPTSTSPPETTSEDYDDTTTGPSSTSPPETTSEDYDDTTTGPSSTSPPETTSEDYDDTTTGPTSTSPPETTSEDYDDTTTGPTSTSPPETTSEDYDDTTTGPTSTSPPETTSEDYDDTTTGPTSTSPPETTSEEYDDTTTGPTSTSPPETTSEDYDDTTTGPTSTSPPETTSEDYDDTTTGPTSSSLPTASEGYDDTTTGPTSTSPPETTSENYDDTTTGPTSSSLPTTSEDYDDTPTGPTSTSPPETTSEDYDDTTTGPTSSSLPTTSEGYDDTTTGPTSTFPATTPEDSTTTTQTELPPSTTELPSTTNETLPSTTELPSTTPNETPPSTTDFSNSTSTEKPVTTTESITEPVSTTPEPPSTSSNCLMCNATDRHGTQWIACSGETIVQKCPGNSDGDASWTCMVDGNFNGSTPDYSLCKNQWLGEIIANLEAVDSLSDDEANALIGEIKMLLQESADPESGTIYFGHEMKSIFGTGEKILSLLEDTNQFEAITGAILDIFSDVLTFRDPWTELLPKPAADAGSSFISGCENSALELARSRRAATKIVKREVPTSERATQDVTTFEDFVEFRVMSGLSFSPDMEEPLLTYPETYSSKDSRIEIPNEWISLFPQGVAFTGMDLIPEYVNLIFPPNLTSGNEKSENQVINGKLMSFTLNTPSSATLRRVNFTDGGVKITFRHDVFAYGSEVSQVRRKLHEGERRKAVLDTAACVYWNSVNLVWSSEGCRLIASDRDESVCECDHLTSFAIIMDLHDYIGKDLGLEVLTFILLPISVLCLVLCIVIFAYNQIKQQALITHPRNDLVIHLCSTLLIANLLLLITVDKNYLHLSDGTCVAFAIILHYVFLCAFAWMAAEGVLLAKLIFIDIFGTGMDYLKTETVAAYLIPAVIVGITCAINFSKDHHGYGNDSYCWLNGNYLWSFAGPVAVVVIFNTAALISSVRKSYNLHKHPTVAVQRKAKSASFWIRASLSLTALMGITWIFGFLMFINNSTFANVAAYIFTVFNASQGIFIFVCYVVLNEKIRKSLGICVPRKPTGSGTEGGLSSSITFGSRMQRTTKRVKEWFGGKSSTPEDEIAGAPSAEDRHRTICLTSRSNSFNSHSDA